MSNIRSGSQYIAVPGAAPDSKVTRDKITGDLHGVSAQVAEDLLSQHLRRRQDHPPPQQLHRDRHLI